MAENLEVGKVYVKIITDLNEFSKGLAAAQLKLSTMSSKMVAMGTKMQSLGMSLSKSVTLPILAMGAVVAKVANDFDNAYATIRAQTGATGQELENLKDSMKAVFAEVPNSMDDVATAISQVSTMMDLEGKALEEMSTTLLDLSRMLDLDVNSAVTTSARVFGDWSIATEDQTEALDYLFKVAQSSGIEFTTLAERIVYYGASLRQLGYSFEEAAALMGKFYKEGVNVEVVMSALRMGISSFTDMGVTDFKAAFTDIIEQIQAMESATEQVALSKEIFGTKAGVDFAKAIAEGRFELEDYLEILDKLDDSIADAGDETLTFADSLRMMKNEIWIALEPLGRALVKAFEDNKEVISDFIGILTKLVGAFSNLPDNVQGTVVKMLLFAAALGPALKMVGLLTSGVGQLIGILGKLWTALEFVGLTTGLGGAGAVLGAGLAAGGLIYLFYDLWTTKKDATKGESWGPNNYYEGYNATTPVVGMDYGWDLMNREAWSPDAWWRAKLEQAMNPYAYSSLTGEKRSQFEAAIAEIESDYQSMINSMEEESVTLDITADATEALYTFEELREAMADISTNYGQTLATQIQDMFDMMRGFTYDVKYLDSEGKEQTKAVNYYGDQWDMTSQWGVAKGNQLLEFFDTSSFREQLNYSQEQAQLASDMFDAAREQLDEFLVLNNITEQIYSAAEEAMGWDQLSVEQQEQVKEQLLQMVTGLADYKDETTKAIEEFKASMEDATTEITDDLSDIVGNTSTIADNTDDPIIVPAPDVSIVNNITVEAPGYATGGVRVNKPTLAWVGENEPEYILTEDQMRNVARGNGAVANPIPIPDATSGGRLTVYVREAIPPHKLRAMIDEMLREQERKARRKGGFVIATD